MVYLCDVCGEKFSRVWSLEKHVKQIHDFSYLCDLCGFKTNDKQTSIIHKKQHTQEHFQCAQCNKNLKSRKSLLRHVSDQHEIKRFSCLKCNYKTNRAYLLSEHKKTHIKKLQVSVKSDRIQNSKTLPQPAQQDEAAQHDDSTQQDEVVRSAFKGKIQERVWNIRGCTDPLGALNQYKNRIRDALLLSLKKNPQKFYIAVKVKFSKIDKDGFKIEDNAFFMELCILS